MTTAFHNTQKETDLEIIEDRVLGRRLQDIRQRALLTRAELATLAAIPPEELADYETGSIPIGIGRLRQLAAALDTDAVTLLCRILFPLS